MDEQKKDETTTATGTETPEVETVIENVVEVASTEAGEAMTKVSEVVSEMADNSEVVETVNEVAAAEVANVPSVFNYKIFFGAIVAILVIAAGLIFTLEKEGRISTGIFSPIIEKMEAKSPAAKVNDTVITKAELESSLSQLVEMAGAQGANVSDATILANLKQQAIETLINGELLRQAAISAGKSVTDEDVAKRFAEIESSLGGAEALALKMKEFGVDVDSLKRDIQNEFLIQAYFDDKKIGQNYIAVTDEEIIALYNQAKTTTTDLPPLSEVKEQVASQIKLDKEQVQIGDLLKTLREEAEVEVLI